MPDSIRSMTLAQMVKAARSAGDVVILDSDPEHSLFCDVSWLPLLFDVLNRDHAHILDKAMRTAVVENAARQMGNEPRITALHPLPRRVPEE